MLQCLYFRFQNGDRYFEVTVFGVDSFEFNKQSHYCSSIRLLTLFFRKRMQLSKLLIVMQQLTLNSEVMEDQEGQVVWYMCSV